MWVKQGRIQILNELWNWWTVYPANYKLALILEDFTEDDENTWSTLGLLDHVFVGQLDAIFPNIPAVMGDETQVYGTRVDWTNESGETKTVYGWAIVRIEAFLFNAQRLDEPAEVADGDVHSFRPVIRCADLGL